MRIPPGPDSHSVLLELRSITEFRSSPLDVTNDMDTLPGDGMQSVANSLQVFGA